MNIFLYEFKAYSKSTIVWTLVLVVLVFLLLSLFPSFARDIESVKTILEAYPEAVKKALSLSINDLSSLLGFYAFIFVYIVLCGAVQAMNLGLAIISKEGSAKTADFLFTKPATRFKVMTAKLLAAFSLIVITNVVYLLAALAMAIIVSNDSFSLKSFILISLSLFFVQLLFMVLGTMIAAGLFKIKSVISVSLGTVLSFFIISMLGSVIGSETLRYITPFKYFDTIYIIQNKAYETSFIIIEMLFIIVALSMSYVLYLKKDIHTV